MDQYKESINHHYTRDNLGSGILAAMVGAGKDIHALTREDISTFDMFYRSVP